MSINVNENVYIGVDPSVTDGIDWTPNQGASVEGNDYGQLLEVTEANGKLTVTTSKGVLEFSGVMLEPAEEMFGENDVVELDLVMSKLATFSFIELMSLLVEAQQNRKEAERLNRATERDAAETEALNAADKLREGAAFKLGFAIAMNTINIGMSAFALGKMGSSFAKMKGPTQNLQMAKTESRIANTQHQLNSTRAEIRTNGTQINQLKRDNLNPNIDTQTRQANEAKIAQLEQRNATLVKQEAKLQTRMDNLKADLKTKITSAEQQLEKADQKVAEKRDAIENPTGADKLKSKAQRQESYEKALNDRDLAQKRLDGLKSVDAKANSDMDSQQMKQWAEESDVKLQAAHKEFQDTAVAVQADTQKAEVWRSLGTGVGGLLDSVGTYIETDYQAQSKEDDAAAEQRRYNAENANEEMKSADEILKAAMDMWQKIVDDWKQSYRQIQA